MWKDWKDVALVLIGIMLFAPFLSHVHRTSAGESIFAGEVAQAPAAKAQTKPTAPLVLTYHASGPDAHAATYAYGPARKAQVRCSGGRTLTLRWAHADHSTRVPAGCTVVVGPGVGISSGAA